MISYTGSLSFTRRTSGTLKCYISSNISVSTIYRSLSPFQSTHTLHRRIVFLTTCHWDDTEPWLFFFFNTVFKKERSREFFLLVRKWRRLRLPHIPICQQDTTRPIYSFPDITIFIISHLILTPFPYVNEPTTSKSFTSLSFPPPPPP